MKKIGILGGAEFIGCYITLKLLAEDYHVKVQISQKRNTISPPFFDRISGNSNIKVCKIDLNDATQLQNFISDCEILIHCGTPLKLGIENFDTQLYVPVIKNTGRLMKIVSTNPRVKKMIFITSAAVFNPGQPFRRNLKRKISGDSTYLENSRQLNKALLHAEKSVFETINNFSDDFFEVIYISPIEVKNNELSNSRGSTEKGLQYLFKSNIKPDPYFQRILKQKKLDSMGNVDELPERIFRTVQANETAIVKP
ncbi:MAG: NAD-dependent epimerase/dehydratase family protein [Bacteroidota bacterium]